MLGEGGTDLSDLEATVRCFLQRELRGVDLKRYRAVIDSLEGDFSSEAHDVQKTGGHLADGTATVVTWISRTCGMSATSAADRVCVGKELESLPKIADALRSGEIGYQSTSLLCHLREQLGDQRDLFDEEEMLGHARRHSVASLRYLCRVARHVADPDGFFNEAEADYSRRRLHVSLMGDGMHAIDGVLDPECGAALKTALDSLAKRLGPDDDRSHRQRMADSLGELVHHAMDEGRLPKRNGVRPHVSLTTTLEGLKNEVGALPADLELSLPISTRTLERIACDCTMSRVLLADSMVTSDAQPELSRRRCGERCAPAIAVAGGRVAIARSTGRHPITSWPGREAVQVTSPIWSCSASSTIGSCTKVDGRWSKLVGSSGLYRPIAW